LSNVVITSPCSFFLRLFLPFAVLFAPDDDDDGGLPLRSLLADDPLPADATSAPSSGALPDDGHEGVPLTPPSSAPDDKSAHPSPPISPHHLRRRLLFSPRPPPSHM
jgi:hypothetical protein